jgi:iron(III) transport system permease protein
MSSCLWLERPGPVRTWGVIVLLGLALLPAVPLLKEGLTPAELQDDLRQAVAARALQNSAVVALFVAGVSLALGGPAGVLTALYDFPGRAVLLAASALPLLVPSFLWAIGWYVLAVSLDVSMAGVLSGRTGCVVVFSAGAVPLVLLTSYAATMTLSQSQVEAARLAGGERAVFSHASRHAATPACLAAALAGVLTLSDPGSGLILGLPTAASEILTSFAARHDYALAGRQCAVLTALVLAFAVPLAWLAAPRLATEMLARSSRRVQRARSSWTSAASASLMLLILAGTTAPVLGLTLPVLRGGDFSRAWGDVARTAGNTIGYALGAGAVATTIGLAVALCVGRGPRLRVACLGICLALFSLPPALAALGIAQMAARAPAWTDPLLRSRFTVCLALGLRFVPVATILGLRSWGSMPASWAQVAALHGVPLGKYLRNVTGPFLLPVGSLALLLVALLATADVGTVHLLSPPGESSLPLTIFTVMANTREARVSALCLVYIGLAAAGLALTWLLAGRRGA